MNSWYPFSSEPDAAWDENHSPTDRSTAGARTKAALLAALVVCLVGGAALTVQAARPDPQVGSPVPVAGHRVVDSPAAPSSTASSAGSAAAPTTTRPSSVADRRTGADPRSRDTDRRTRPGREWPGRQRPPRTWSSTTPTTTTEPTSPWTAQHPTTAEPTAEDHLPTQEPDPTHHHVPTPQPPTVDDQPSHDQPSHDDQSGHGAEPAHEPETTHDAPTHHEPTPEPEHHAVVSIDAFHPSTTQVSCVDEFDSLPVTISWSSTGAARAWFGIDTTDAVAAPLQEVPTSGSFTWDFFCSNTSTVYTVSVVGDSGTQHRSVTVTRA